MVLIHTDSVNNMSVESYVSRFDEVEETESGDSIIAK